MRPRVASEGKGSLVGSATGGAAVVLVLVPVQVIFEPMSCSVFCWAFSALEDIFGDFQWMNIRFGDN